MAGKPIATTFFVFLIVGIPATTIQKAEDLAKTDSFAALVERFSEESGRFRSDNLISNEVSYQHVLGKLDGMNLTGGAYLGVGPDQNFTYIAQIKPRIAFMIDIRRDCLLQHLLFKAIFQMARNRVEYMSFLLGRSPPRDIEWWDDKTLMEIVDYIDRTPVDDEGVERTRMEVRRMLSGFGVPLSEHDVETIERVHRAFYRSGLDLRYTVRAQSPDRFSPVYRDILLERDLDGRLRNYLVKEEDFQFIKSMQDRDLIIPVTGDLAGPRAVRAIGAYIRAMGEKVSAFYTSNVEYYVFRNGRFGRFVDNVRSLPFDGRSLLIRSVFNYMHQEFRYPQTVGDSFSVQLLQTFESLVDDANAGGYQNYYDLVTRRSVELHPATL